MVAIGFPALVGLSVTLLMNAALQRWILRCEQHSCRSSPKPHNAWVHQLFQDEKIAKIACLDLFAKCILPTLRVQLLRFCNICKTFDSTWNIIILHPSPPHSPKFIPSAWSLRQAKLPINCVILSWMGIVFGSLYLHKDGSVADGGNLAPL